MFANSGKQIELKNEISVKVWRIKSFSIWLFALYKKSNSSAIDSSLIDNEPGNKNDRFLRYVVISISIFSFNRPTIIENTSICIIDSTEFRSSLIDIIVSVYYIIFGDLLE